VVDLLFSLDRVYVKIIVIGWLLLLLVVLLLLRSIDFVDSSLNREILIHDDAEANKTHSGAAGTAQCD
jgi:hypothetical protein